MHQLIDQKKAEVVELCRRFGARRLDAFGSVVRADFDPLHSDIDFVVDFESAAPSAYAQAYFALKTGLEGLFGRPVDLVTESSFTNPFFKQRVDSERQTVYAS